MADPTSTIAETTQSSLPEQVIQCLSLERVEDALASFSIKYHRREDEIIAQMEWGSVFFELAGSSGQVLEITALFNNVVGSWSHSVLVVLNEWSTTHRWPTAYLDRHQQDILAKLNVLCDPGISDQQLTNWIAVSMDTVRDLARYLDEKVRSSAQGLPSIDGPSQSGMFKLDDSFLKDTGVDDLPAELREPFLQHVYSTIEMRVGEQLTEGMSDNLLDEFGYFVDMDEAGMAKWFDLHLPDYTERDDYQALKKANPDAPEAAILSEYGAMKWLQLNRPDYPQVVGSVLDGLKAEISAHAKEIIGTAEDDTYADTSTGAMDN